jgi:hypothetical protein
MSAPWSDEFFFGLLCFEAFLLAQNIGKSEVFSILTHSGFSWHHLLKSYWQNASEPFLYLIAKQIYETPSAHLYLAYLFLRSSNSCIMHALLSNGFSLITNRSSRCYSGTWLLCFLMAQDWVTKTLKERKTLKIRKKFYSCINRA